MDRNFIRALFLLRLHAFSDRISKNFKLIEREELRLKNR
jgi:hypothetical protein